MNFPAAIRIRLLIAVLSIAFFPHSEAQNPADAPGLMQNLCRICEKIKPLSKPPVKTNGRNDGRFDGEVRDFESAVESIAHYVEELRKIDKDIENSNRVINGKPFSETLKAAQEIIKANQMILAAEPSRAALGLMNALDDECREITALTISELEPGSYNLVCFMRTTNSFQMHMKRLQILGIDVEHSNQMVHGKPISETIKNAQAVIAANQATSANIPNAKALSAIDMAISCAKVGQLRLDESKKTKDVSFFVLEGQFDAYTRFKKEALTIDAKVLEYRKVEIQKCENGFVAEFLVIKGKMEQLAEAKRRESQAAKNAEVAKQNAEANRREAIAKKKGFTAHFYGINELMSGFRNGGASLNFSKKLLIFVDDEDESFEVTSTSDKYVFYATKSGAMTQIAVERIPGELYSNGSHLMGDMFSVVGSGLFKTALGTELDLVIFKQESH